MLSAPIHQFKPRLIQRGKPNDPFTLNYYDEDSLRYLFSVPIWPFRRLSSPLAKTRLISGIRLMQLESQFALRSVFPSPIRTLGPTSQGFDDRYYDNLFEVSQAVEFAATQQQFASMFRRSGTGPNAREKTGYIVFDPRRRRVFFEELPVRASLMEAEDPYQAGQLYLGFRVLANVHTHPAEVPYLKMGVPDAAIYQAQYANIGSDGRTAVSRKTPRYTLGLFNVDYFSPAGAGHSRNNLATMAQLKNGSFNIYQHAFEVYGGKLK